MARAKTDPAGGGEKSLSQMGMVRESLKELGGNPKPQAIQEHIKTKYNRDIPANIISNYKSQIRRKGGGSGNGRRRGRPPRAAAGLQVEHFEAIRQLVRQLGADQVKRLVDVVG
jgi:hypothetical protein